MANYIENQGPENEEVSLKEAILKAKAWWQFIFSKKKQILIISIIGAALGLTYSILKKPIYKGELTFALQDEKSAGGLSSALGIASQFGIDLGGGAAGGEFSGDNLIELMKSRYIVTKTLLTPLVINGKKNTLADRYIDFNHLHERWADKPGLKNIVFLKLDTGRLTLEQDSVLGLFYKDLMRQSVDVSKIDKKLSIITVNINSKDELFSKTFAEVLVKVVSDYYIQTKTQKAARNVAILQHQTDSVRAMLNGAISGVAQSADVNPNPNPFLSTLKVTTQRRSVDVQANSAILTELVKNLEVAKMSLMQATPIIQIIDRPTLPLEKDRFGKAKGIVLGGFLFFFFATSYFTINKYYKTIINES